MAFIDHGVVENMQSLGLALMVVAGEGCVLSCHQEIISDQSIPLNLHDAIIAAITQIVLDTVDRTIVGSIGDDTRIVAIVDQVVANGIAPRSLLDLDSIALRSKAVVDMIASDQALAHPHLTIVSAQVHPFSRSTSIVDGIVDQEEKRAIGGVRAETDIRGVMDMTMIHEKVMAGSYAKAMTASTDFQSLQYEILRGMFRIQTNVQNILTIV